MKAYPEKRIMITGAGSGLGRALALEYARKNWKVCIAEIDMKSAKETEKLVKEAGGEPLTIACDVTKPEDFTKIAKSLKSKWGGVDIVVNNAGVAAGGWMEKIPLKDWDWIIDINFKSIVYSCRTFIPMMEKQGKGHIVNIASAAGLICFPEMISYNATKAAVIALSKTLRVELAPKNINVTVVTPTFFKSNLLDRTRVISERQADMANAFFDRISITSEKVAKRVVKGIKRRRFYLNAILDGKILWFFHRMTPNITLSVTSFLYKHGIADRILLGKKD